MALQQAPDAFHYVTAASAPARPRFSGAKTKPREHVALRKHGLTPIDLQTCVKLL